MAIIGTNLPGREHPLRSLETISVLPKDILSSIWQKINNDGLQIICMTYHSCILVSRKWNQIFQTDFDFRTLLPFGPKTPSEEGDLAAKKHFQNIANCWFNISPGNSFFELTEFNQDPLRSPDVSYYRDGQSLRQGNFLFQLIPEKMLVVYKTDQTDPILQIPNSCLNQLITNFKFNQEANTLAVIRGKSIEFWDMNQPSESFGSITLKIELPQNIEPSRCCLSILGKCVYFAGPCNSKIQVWDFKTAKTNDLTFNNEFLIERVEISRSEERLVIITGAKSFIWNIKEKTIECSYPMKFSCSLESEQSPFIFFPSYKAIIIHISEEKFYKIGYFSSSELDEQTQPLFPKKNFLGLTNDNQLLMNDQGKMKSLNLSLPPPTSESILLKMQTVLEGFKGLLSLSDRSTERARVRSYWNQVFKSLPPKVRDKIYAYLNEPMKSENALEVEKAFYNPHLLTKSIQAIEMYIQSSKG